MAAVGQTATTVASLDAKPTITIAVETPSAGDPTAIRQAPTETPKVVGLPSPAPTASTVDQQAAPTAVAQFGDGNAAAGGPTGGGASQLPQTSAPTPSAPTNATAIAATDPASPASPTAFPDVAPAPTVVAAQPDQEQSAGKNTRLWRAKGAQLAEGQLDGVVAGQNDIRLAGEASSYARSAMLISGVHEAAFPFYNAVLSWNATTPAGTALRFELRARVGEAATGRWTPWYVMGTWSASGGASSRGQSDEWAAVETDTLVLSRAADAWQYRVVFSSDGPATPTLRALGLVYADLRSRLSGPPISLPAGWARELPVPAYSQLEEEGSIARVICSPTSLTMLVNYYGGKKTVAEVARGVRDGASGIFGNWPLNTAYAATLGFDAYVDRFYSIKQVASLIAAGQPVAASIRYGPGELPGAPLYQTSGHLIVIRGFTADGRVIINDPFVEPASLVRRVVRSSDLENVWLRSGGVVYLLDRLAS